MELEDRMCRIRGEKEEKVEHVLYEYLETIGVRDRLVRQNLFDKEGKGIGQMKEL